VTEIGETLIHEVGHYFGMDEEQIEEIEDRYWNRRQETGAGSRTAAGAEEDEAEDGLESGDDEDER